MILSKTKALAVAVDAARAVGRLMRKNHRTAKTINSEYLHDIKLELDVRSQKLIEKKLHRAFPKVAFLGEEGCSGDPKADFRWVVDPIDGTVNFTYEIPHCCVSIALQKRSQETGVRNQEPGYETLVGVVYDPFCDELWTAIRGRAAYLNGKKIRVSQRRRLQDCIVSIGFGKSKESVEKGLPYLRELLRSVRKVRMMGAAALGMTYVASGRFDAYMEKQICLWDIAAGGLILECAGGEFWHQRIEGEHNYQVLANNGRLRRTLENLRATALQKPDR
ncbi:MAG: inositol monophosphatase family protein [Verrucomicrobiota bacterium]